MSSTIHDQARPDCRTAWRDRPLRIGNNTGLDVGPEDIEDLRMEPRALPEIESRPYGPDCTQAERDALLQRVEIIAPRVIRYREIPVQSVFSVELMLAHMDQLSRPWPTFVELLDLSLVRRPGPEVREALKARIRTMLPRIDHMAIIVHRNIVIRAMARIFALSLGAKSVSIHETEEQALEAVNNAIAA